jgi:hypothetical protein
VIERNKQCAASGVALEKALRPNTNKTMKKYFQNRLEAIDWIAEQAENEGQFEVLREQLQFNFIYTGTYFLELEDEPAEVVWLNNTKTF